MAIRCLFLFMIVFSDHRSDLDFPVHEWHVEPKSCFGSFDFRMIVFFSLERIARCCLRIKKQGFFGLASHQPHVLPLEVFT
jgi:hypothetical protein